MKLSSMPFDHQTHTPWLARLGPGEVRRLAPVRCGSALRVESGALWITPDRCEGGTGDLWLAAGAVLELPGGSAWVLQAWPEARVLLLESWPAASAPRPVWQRLSGVWRGLRARLRAAQPLPGLHA